MTNSSCFDLQIPSPITVTIGLEWNVSTIGKPIPTPYTTQVTEGTVLVDILNKAADDDVDSPFNRYQSTYSVGLGRSITVMNGVRQVCIWFFASLITGLSVGLATFDKWRMRKTDYFISAYRVLRTTCIG